MRAGAELVDLRERIGGHIVGRERELDLLLAAVSAGCDVILEGPPGTSKTTMLKAITREWDIPLLFVEGNADLTTAKLVGQHDPARVLQEDYGAQNFVAGPLVEAMQTGGFLYIEELNRAPEETLNALLPAIGDRKISIPRVGVVTAEPTFRLIASMNPYDNVGTSRLSSSIHDRVCRVAVGYQDGDAERAIVATHSGIDDSSALETRIAADAVAVTRATRTHRDLRMGSSVRGAIDLLGVARYLMAANELESPDDERYPSLLLDAATVSLSGRIHLDESADTTPEAVIQEIVDYVLGPVVDDPG